MESKNPGACAGLTIQFGRDPTTHFLEAAEERFETVILSGAKDLALPRLFKILTFGLLRHYTWGIC
jgi:hypothetical protein